MRLNLKQTISYGIMIALTAIFILIISQPPEEPSAEAAERQAAGQELDAFDAEDLALSNDRFALSFDGRYGSVHIVDKRTGRSWDSVPPLDEATPPNNRRFMRSPVHIRYTEGKGNTQTYPFKEQGKMSARLSNDGQAILVDMTLTNLQMAFTMEYRLNDTGLEVTIPYESVKDGEEKKLVSIEVMPFFEAASEHDEGAMVIPDGSGALIRFKEKHRPYFYPYSEFVYGGDHAYQKNVYQKVKQNTREMQSYGPREWIALPVYGMYKKDKAFLAVLHDGEEDAMINATPAGIRNIKLYRASGEFLYRNDDIIFLGSSGEIPITLSELIPGDRSVRFILLQGEQADYVGMASAYRDYLLREKGVVPVDDQETKLQLRLFGGVQQAEIIGSKFIAMTTFAQGKVILDQLLERGIDDVEVTLEGWAGDGEYGDRPDHLPAEGKLGGNKGLRALGEYAARHGIDLYVSTNYVKPYKKSDALRRSRDAIRGLNKEVLKAYEPNVTTRQASNTSFYYLKPKGVYDRYIVREAPELADLKIHGVRLDYMGYTSYSDPGSRPITFRKETLDTWVGAMDLMRGTVGKAAVEYGMAYAIGHVDRIDDIPLSSSRYIFEDESIPFMQIALHGLVPYTADPSNLRDDPRTGFLRAMEYGAAPSYVLTAEDPVRLKRTLADELFSTRFSDWLDRSLEEYGQASSVLDQAAGEYIVGHDKLQAGVYRTTYGNGLQVSVNYNDYPVTVDGVTLSPYGYAVQGGERRMIKPVKLSMRARHILEGYSFILPWVAGFLLFMAIPLGKSLYYSFNRMDLTTEGLRATYNGLAFYRNAFTVDVEFLPKLMSTVTTMVVHVPLILIFAMFSALLLNRPFRGRMVFRSFFFLPVIIASGVVLQKLMNQGAATLPIFVQYDLANVLSRYVPGEVLLPLLRMMDSLTLVMWDSGVQILIFLAGLQAISPTLYEAAKCDGATPWESFWKITFPMITPMILVNILFSIVNSFTNINNSVMVYINTVAFKQNDYGYGAALGWIYFVIIFLIILLVMFLFRNMESPYTREGR